MAGRLLSVAVAAVLVHGCLLPQDDQVFDDLPPKKNSYPRIVEGLAKPADPVVNLELGTNCPRAQFSIIVEDPDLADRIRSKWFVDTDTTFSGVSFTSTPLTESPTAQRQTAIKPPTQLFSAGSALYEIGQHRLTVVIADGEFEVGIETAPRTHAVFIDGGTSIISDPSYTDSYVWLVNTTRTPCPL